MTNALILHGTLSRRLGLGPHDLCRGLSAGALWSAAMVGGMIVWQALVCGFVDPGQAFETAGLALGAGLFVFGPLAAFGGRQRRP